MVLNPPLAIAVDDAHRLVAILGDAIRDVVA
jgi:hypothetical protein